MSAPFVQGAETVKGEAVQSGKCFHLTKQAESRATVWLVAGVVTSGPVVLQLARHKHFLAGGGGESFFKCNSGIG